MSQTTKVEAEKAPEKDVRQLAPYQLRPSNLKEAMEFSQLIAKSDLVPRDYKGKPGNVLIAIQMGAEIGLSPMQAIQNIAVINGRPSLWGDALLAVVQGHPDCLDVIEEPGDTEGKCTVLRRGRKPVTRTFDIEDAKTAGLWGKQGPWTNYPARMLQMRARAFACRDQFADALRGIQSAEEVRDYTVHEPMGTAGVEIIEETPEAKERRMRESLGGWLMEINTGDVDAAAAHLEQITAFTGDDGAAVPGLKTIKGLTGKRLSVAYGKAKKAYAEWTKSLTDVDAKADDAARQAEEVF